jgi:hypothetical protein
LAITFPPTQENFDRIFIFQSIFRKLAKVQHQKNNSMTFLWMIATLATSQKWKTKNTWPLFFFWRTSFHHFAKRIFKKHSVTNPFLKTRIAKKKTE